MRVSRCRQLTAILLLLLIFGADGREGLAQQPRSSLDESLLAAASAADLRQVEALVAHGANVNTHASNSATPLIFASGGGLPYGCMVDLTAEERRPKVVQTLLENGADINAADDKGMTALIVAAYAGRAKIVEQLLNASAHTNDKDEKGRTALTWAAPMGASDPVVRLLRRKGARIGVTDALLLGYEPTARTLIEQGAEYRVPGPGGETALMLAARQGYAEIVKLLLKKRLDVNQKDAKGFTALMLAAGARPEIGIPSGVLQWTFYGNNQGRVEIVQQLLARGAKVNAQSEEGFTSLMMAAASGQTDVAQILLDRGANIHLKAIVYTNALSLAEEEKRADVVKLLKQAGAVAPYP